MKDKKKVFFDIQDIFIVLLKFINKYHKSKNIDLTIKISDKNSIDMAKPVLVGYLNYDGTNKRTTTINWAGI